MEAQLYEQVQLHTIDSRSEALCSAAERILVASKPMTSMFGIQRTRMLYRNTDTDAFGSSSKTDA